MNPASAPLSEHVKSLVHWLALSGIQTEVSNESRQWIVDPFQSASAAAPIIPARTAPAPSSIDLEIKFNNIIELNDFLKQWKRIGIAKTAMNTVTGLGPENAALMIICDTPDAFEDQKGQAFVGPGNMLILEALRHAGFSRETLYMTYLSKWRPPGQKPLSVAEIDLLATLLEQEIAFTRPKAILAIGESTLKALGMDFLRNTSQNNTENLYTNQLLNYKIPVLSSQKGEILVKTAGMKKNFWLSIINFAATLRAKGVKMNTAPGSLSVNYTE